MTCKTGRRSCNTLCYSMTCAESSTTGIGTGCTSICIINTGEKSPSKPLTRNQSNPRLSSIGIGLEWNMRRYPVVQISSLFPIPCVRADGIDTIPLSTPNQSKAGKLCAHKKANKELFVMAARQVTIKFKMNYRTRRFFRRYVKSRAHSRWGSAGRKKAASALVYLMTLTGECG